MTLLFNILVASIIFTRASSLVTPNLNRIKCFEDPCISDGRTSLSSPFVVPINHQRDYFLPKSRPIYATIVAGVDSSLTRVSLNALAKLISTCGIGVWASKAGFLDKTALSVLSKLIFNLFQPCFLFVNVVSTVANLKATDKIALRILPMMAAFQIGLGFLIGKVVSFLLYGKESTEESRQLVTCTSFGNSGPLPLVFVDALFKSHVDASVLPKSVGYISLYLLGWSPLFWIFAPQVLSSKEEKGKTDLRQTIQKVLSPPVVASILGLIAGSIPFVRNLLTKGFISPVFESARTLGNGYLPAVLLVLAGSLFPTSSTPSTEVVEKGDNDKWSSLKQIASIYAVRFVAMPMVGFGLFRLAKQYLPASSALLQDRLLLFIILLELSMPSAQNSTVIMQLKGNAVGAAKMARVLVAIYVLGVPAMSYWLAQILRATSVL